MATYAKVSNVEAANIAKVNNVSKANIANLHGIETPASGASLWAVVSADAGIGYAASSDLTAWVGYEPETDGSDLASSSKDFINIVYGKDNLGAPLWAICWGDGNREIITNDDITDTDGWIDQHLGGTGLEQRAMAGGTEGSGGNQWVSIGKITGAQSRCWRSADGDTWASIDLSGLDGWHTDTNISGIATDGNGVFMFCQQDRVYKSTNGGAVWGLDTAFHNTDYKLKNNVYTNSSWVIMGEDEAGSDNTIYISCAASNTQDWGTAVDGIIGTTTTFGFFGAAGTCLACNGAAWERLTVSGKTISNLQVHNASNGNGPLTGSGGSTFGGATDVTSDGSGKWIIVGSNGDICLSTDDGINFSNTKDGLDMNPGGSAQVENLKGAASNVFLPV